jgi:hypothetical protein
MMAALADDENENIETLVFQQIMKKNFVNQLNEMI